MTLGYDKPLYILPFDHRATFQTGMFGWKGPLSPAQTAQIAAVKAVNYDALKAAGVPGFIGFAVGRTTFWNPLMALKEQKISREAALTEIAQRYRQWVDVCESARVA